MYLSIARFSQACTLGGMGLHFKDTDMQQNFWVGGREIFIGLFGGWLRLVGGATW